VLVALLLAVVVVVGWWSTEVRPVDRAPRRSRGSPLVATPVPHPRSGRTEPTPTPAPDPEQVALEVVAEAAGHGIVECRLPEVVFAPVEISHDDIAEFQLAGTVLRFRTGAPSGIAALDQGAPDFGRTDDEYLAAIRPFAVVTWSGAGPGKRAECQVAAPRQVRLAGRLVGSATTARRGVIGCEGRGLRVDAEGRFEQLTWAGPPCAFHASESGGLDPAAQVWVERDGDRDDLVVHEVPPPWDDAPGFCAWYRPVVEARLADARGSDREGEALATALRRDDLPDGVRARLEERRSEHQSARAQQLAFLAEQLADLDLCAAEAGEPEQVADP
jgi:hypothetical protein